MLKYYQLLKTRMMKMILRMPEYCRNFRCIADKCKDNCCVGWEIDIDSATAEYYESVQGDFGCKLRSNIDKGKVCSFRLKGERCPFLNDSNLCEIIINLGEDKLCQICSDHPRYFEWYSHIKEGGIGLCCEEAARLIVLSEDGFSTYDVPCDDECCEKVVTGTLRNWIAMHCSDKNLKGVQSSPRLPIWDYTNQVKREFELMAEQSA